MSQVNPLKIAVTGVAGKMGRAVLSELLDGAHPNTILAGALHRKNSDYIGHDAASLAGLSECGILVSADIPLVDVDVMIDFSLPEPALAYLDACVSKSLPLIIGTTGFSAQQRSRIEEASKHIPLVLAPNMSVGVNLSFYLLDQITRVMGADSDIEISETHHRHKLDSPSGTAVRIGEVIAGALDRSLDEIAVYSRQGTSASRSKTEIGFSSLRAGDVVGDHTVLFANDGERLELTHKASSRKTFAKGALRAAAWVKDQPNGFYDMQDVLGLR